MNRILLAIAAFAAWNFPFSSRAAPGEADEPVIFWAHFMPQTPNGHLQSHPHVGGNHDAWALTTQSPSSLEDYKEHMRQALASGINGFQMLTVADKEVYAAASAITKETGTLIYVSPEWCNLPASPEKAGDIIADFAVLHDDDEHVYRRNGAQVHFLYGPGQWASTHEGIRGVMDRLQARGVKVLLVPTIYFFDKIVLDRPDLERKSWPEGKPIEPGATNWLHVTPWQGATCFDFETNDEAVRAVQNRLSTEAPSFYWIPPVSPGYDSSNRPGQAIRTPFNGILNLLQTLRRYQNLGYRQLTCVTWNDCLESMILPSSRNVWGYNTMIRFFHSLVETGKSPFNSPHALVSYPVECLYGDNLWFQVLGLPNVDGELDWQVRVEFEGSEKTESIVLSGQSLTAQKGRESLIEFSLPTDSMVGERDFVQPRVTVDTRQKGSTEWHVLYNRLLLPPIRLRYNLVQFPNPYAIALDRIASENVMTLNVERGIVDHAAVSITGNSPVRRLVLSDGSMSLGVFRATRVDQKGSKLLKDLFVRIEASENIPLRLRVENGIIHDLFSPHYDLKRTVVPIEKSDAVFPASQGFRTRVARFDVAPDGRVDLGADGGDESLVTTLPELQRGVVAKKILWQGRPVTLSLVLTADATEPNIDFPLPSHGTFLRRVPLAIPHEGVRVLHATAWLASGQLAISPPVVLASASKLDERVEKVSLIHTGGTFDSFVDPFSAPSLNPFSPNQVLQGHLTRNRIPYFHLNFAEGAGARLNDRGFSQQAGRAWIEAHGPIGHQANFANEEDAGFQWLSDGPFGRSLSLGPDLLLRFRSKSAPVGPVTISLWIDAVIEKDGKAGWGVLRADPFRLDLTDKEAPLLTFKRAGLVAKAPISLAIHSGWNHFALVYDLNSIRCYHDGQLIGENNNVPPFYQRTHLTPAIGFERPLSQAPSSPKVANIEVIGAALDVSEIKSLLKSESWRPSETSIR